MNIKLFSILFCIGAGLLLPRYSCAWNDTTHILVAQIAKQNLNSGVMNKIVNQAEDIDGEFPPPFDFETSACWANDISRSGLKALDAWHEKLIPYDPSGIVTEEKRKNLLVAFEKNSVSFALTEAMRTLKNPKSGPWEKNFMLRILLNCIGDIHHPLHCVTLYSHEFPHGDDGGRHFKINGRIEKSLREFWDNLSGNYVRGLYHDQTYEEMVEMELTLEKIVTDYPPNSFDKKIGETFDDWAEESHQLAIRFAYQGISPGDNPSKEYVARARMITYRQIASAGYRLADILNEVFVD